MHIGFLSNKFLFTHMTRSCLLVTSPPPTHNSNNPVKPFPGMLGLGRKQFGNQGAAGSHEKKKQCPVGLGSSTHGKADVEQQRKNLTEAQWHPSHPAVIFLSIHFPFGLSCFKLNFYHLYLKYFWPIHHFSPLNPALNYCQLKFYLPWDSQLTFCSKANKRIQIICHNDEPQFYVQSI